MSKWRNIWHDAVDANSEMMNDTDSGLIEFYQLLKDHPDDGMIYYERAEAYEYLGQKTEALKDYQIAKDKLPRAKWNKLAEFGICRLNNSEFPEVEESYKEWASNYHLLHQMKNLAFYKTNKFLIVSALAKIETAKEEGREIPVPKGKLVYA